MKHKFNMFYIFIKILLIEKSKDKYQFCERFIMNIHKLLYYIFITKIKIIKHY